MSSTEPEVKISKSVSVMKQPGPPKKWKWVEETEESKPIIVRSQSSSNKSCQCSQPIDCSVQSFCENVCDHNNKNDNNNGLKNIFATPYSESASCAIDLSVSADNGSKNSIKQSAPISETTNYSASSGSDKNVGVEENNIKIEVGNSCNMSPRRRKKSFSIEFLSQSENNSNDLGSNTVASVIKIEQRDSVIVPMEGVCEDKSASVDKGTDEKQFVEKIVKEFKEQEKKKEADKQEKVESQLNFLSNLGLTTPEKKLGNLNVKLYCCICIC